ncbi:MAG: DNA translocase FtsK [Bacillota bacterium]|nr:DNA translocase FtsK [Bacillota bacterium]
MGLLMLALAVYVFLSLYTQTGIIGNLLKQFLVITTGEVGAFFAPGLLAFFGFNLCWNRKPLTMNPLVGGVLLFFLILVTACHLLPFPQSLARNEVIKFLWSTGLKGEGGGILGAACSISAVFLLGQTGAIIFMIALCGIDLVLLTGISTKKLFRSFGSTCLKIGCLIKAKTLNFLFIEEEIQPQEGEGREEKEEENSITPVIIDHNFHPETKEQPEKPLEPVEEKQTGPPDFPQNYNLPPLTLLTRPLKVKSSRLNKEIIENVRILEETLESFGVKVCVSQVHRGPAITRYEIQPAPGIKVSKIVRLTDDIALSLAAPDVRIEAPIPGKAALGIEVPNKEVAPVYLREILETNEFQEAASKLTVALGKDIAGNPIIADLIKMPHLLLAGATGSGKSICLNAIICSILFKAHPNEVKFLLIDPKMVELITYNGIPHLLSPVVTEPKKAASALKWIVREMESRYELFASLGVRDINRYNLQFCNQNQRGYLPLPYITVVIDELADLMMIAPVEVEDAICRLAQMARAAGIHLVVATQRPSVDVITGVIKANIPSRIAFAVSSQTDSRTILDLNGAEKLLGKGDMLFLPVGAIKPIRIQGALVTDSEVEEIVTYISKQGQPFYSADFPESEESPSPEGDFGDPLFLEAAKLVIEIGHASVSLLQRRFRIGYARAARIIDILEQKGIVGPFEGAKPRSILITPEQFYRYYGK